MHSRTLLSKHSLRIMRNTHNLVSPSLSYKVSPTLDQYNGLQYSYGSRHLHTTRPKESLIMGGIGVVILSVGANQLYKHYQASQSKTNSPSTKSSSNTTEAPKSEDTSSTTSSNTASTGLFSNWFARNFYDGGFEEKMTKREAALILGVRESATPDRIKDAHRRILMLNHPDRGGSAYVAAKVNEAKLLLMKGKN